MKIKVYPTNFKKLSSIHKLYRLYIIKNNVLIAIKTLVSLFIDSINFIYYYQPYLRFIRFFDSRISRLKL